MLFGSSCDGFLGCSEPGDDDVDAFLDTEGQFSFDFFFSLITAPVEF